MERRRRTHSDFIQNGSNSDHNADVVPDLLAAPEPAFAGRSVAPVSIFVGLALEGLKYLTLLTWPFLRAKLEHEYGPFINSVTIVLWSFLASMVVLAGAEWSARRRDAGRIGT